MNSAEQVNKFKEKPLEQRLEQFKKFQSLHSGRIPVLISTRNPKIPLTKVTDSSSLPFWISDSPEPASGRWGRIRIGRPYNCFGTLGVRSGKWATNGRSST